MIKLGVQIGFVGFVAFSTFQVLVGIANAIIKGVKRSDHERESDKVTKMPGSGKGAQ